MRRRHINNRKTQRIQNILFDTFTDLQTLLHISQQNWHLFLEIVWNGHLLTVYGLLHMTAWISLSTPQPLFCAVISAMTMFYESAQAEILEFHLAQPNKHLAHPCSLSSCMFPRPHLSPASFHSNSYEAWSTYNLPQLSYHLWVLSLNA
jgi:hypothetical protein